VSERGLGAPVGCPYCGKSFALTLNMLMGGAGVATAAAPAATSPQAGVVPATAAPLLPSAGGGPALQYLEIGAATSPGKVRPRNEDAYLVRQFRFAGCGTTQELALLVVADGMGGHEGGELASLLVVRTVGALLEPLCCEALAAANFEPAPIRLADTLDAALGEANLVIWQRAQAGPAYKGMGATAAAVLLWQGRAFLSHVGDCRVYLFRGGDLTQLTRDQTLVGRMVELGQLTEEEAAIHPSRNEVLQAVGRRPELAPARHQIDLVPGDWLLVASDGLAAHVPNMELQRIMQCWSGGAGPLAQHLVQTADARGGSDNSTVIAVRAW